MSETLSIDAFLDTTGPSSPARLLVSRMSSQAASSISLVSGDRPTFRLWLLKPSSSLGQSPECLTHSGAIVFSLKADPSDADALAQVDTFTLVQSTNDGDHYEAPLDLNTAVLLEKMATLPRGTNSFEGWFDIELQASGNINRRTFQGRAIVNRQVYVTGPAPATVPSYPAPGQLATKADLAALQGGVTLSPWANSTEYPFAQCIIGSDGQPSQVVLEDSLGEMTVSLPAWTPTTVSVQGTLSKTNIVTATIRQVDAGGALLGNEVNLGATVNETLPIESGAVALVIYFSRDTGASAPGSVVFTSWTTTAHAALSELTAEALAEIEQHKTNASQWAYDALTSKGAANDSATYAASFEAAAEVSKNNAQQSAENADGFRNDAQVSAAAAAAAELAAGNADKLGKGDARVQALGGVSLIGDNGGTAGWGHVPAVPQLSEYFELYFKCRRGATVGVSDRRTIAAITTDDGEHVALNFGNAAAAADCYVGFNNAYGALGAAVGDLSWKHVTYGRDSVGYFVTVDGVKSYNNNFGITGKPVAIERVYGGPQGGHGQYHGDVSVAIAFNFPLSDAQRAKLLLNEPGADVIGRGAQQAVQATIGGGYDRGVWFEAFDGSIPAALSGVSSTGATATAEGYFGPSFNEDLSTGRRIRVSYNATSGHQVLLRARPPVYDACPAQEGVSGMNVIELTALSDAYAVFWRAYTAPFTISGLKIEILGARGRWEPLNWTGLGRGLDSSGNGNDIIPVGKGVTPINPLPPRSWSVRYTLNFNTQSPTATRTDGGGASPFNNITFADGFNALMWFDSWLPDSVRRSGQLRVFDIGGAAAPTRLYGNASPAYDYMAASSTPGGNTVGSEFTWKE